jgi:hypothetical protein
MSNLIKFQDYPSTETPLNAENLNHNFNELNKQNTFLEEEQVIGTWLGKPLYRKIISMNIPTTATDGTLVSSEEAHNIENMDTFYIKNSFFIDNQGVSFKIPAVTMGTTTNKVRVDLTKSALRAFNTVSYWSGFTLYAVVEYTKTTD